MSNKRLLLVGGVLVVILVGAAAAWWAIAPDRLEHLAEEVRHGMTEAEVEAILDTPFHKTTFPDDGKIMHKWVTDRVIVVVLFEPDGRVERIVVHRRPLWDRIQDLRK